MTAERWQRVKRLLDAALDLPASERPSFLDAECADDPQLRTEVQSLIASHEQSGDFLDGPPIPAPATTVGAATGTARAGERIGSYRVVREIGRGGMGAVYMAVRADESFRKQVAIKVLRRALATDYIQKRFRTERQILASLNHPNIAQLLDGGTTADGLPYFVMEYVDGDPIDAYCDRNKLSTTERLRLFAKICSAVDCAHQQRIVHRDIKPANILINSAAEPKLLDFGIAKMLDPDAADLADPTITQLRMLTPEYASPEQIRGEAATPATDIYSLGVLLYELLTGHKPYRTRSRTPHEIAHAICEEDPEKPSTVIKRVDHTTRGAGQPTTITPESVSAVRSTEPGELRRRLSGDLDNIVLMAMRKEPERRYRTAGELGEDILRHLDRRTVRARGDTITYRAAKSIVRHRGAIAVAGIAAIGGILAMSIFERATSTKAPLSELNTARTSPFTAFTGDELQPAFSPDGTRIAFIWRGEDNAGADVYWRETGQGGPPVRLTSSPEDESSPAWSSDGTTVAFLRSGKERAGFYVVPASGGPERLICAAATQGFERLGAQVQWARDGKSLYVIDRDDPGRPFAVYTVALGSGERRRISEPPERSVGDLALSLSPDGETLAVVRALGSGVSELFLLPAKGGPARQLTTDQRWISAVSWAPAGTELVFTSNRIGNPAVFRVPAVGGTPERLAGVGQNTSDAVFSRDGRRLAFTQFTIDSNIWKLDLRTGRAESFIASTQYDSSPHFSPDMKSVVFRSNRSGTNEIWVADGDGRNPRQLTNFRGPLTGSPRWSPDGRWIAFDSRPKGQAHIFLVSPEGGEPRQLTTENAENVVPTFSHDGRYVYFGSNRGEGWQVWRKPVDGGPAEQVTRRGGFVGLESSDGKYVYYAVGRNVPGLRRVPVGGGDEVDVLPDLRAGYWGSWGLLPDGQLLAVDRPSAFGPAIFFRYDPATHRRQVVAHAQKPLVLGSSSVSVSPDGRYALFTQQDHSSSDIMLAELSGK